MRPECELIIEPVRGRFALATSPKVACHSLRLWLWECGTGEPWSGGSAIWKRFMQPDVRKEQLSAFHGPKIAIHRDPVDRLRSVYDHRVRRLGEGWDPGIEKWAENLGAIVARYPSIAHHACPQSIRLGVTPGDYDFIVPFGRLEDLGRLVESVLGTSLPPIPRTNETKRKSVVSPRTGSLFTAYGAYDTALGWDGKLEKLE